MKRTLIQLEIYSTLNDQHIQSHFLPAPPRFPTPGCGYKSSNRKVLSEQFTVIHLAGGFPAAAPDADAAAFSCLLDSFLSAIFHRLCF